MTVIEYETLVLICPHCENELEPHSLVFRCSGCRCIIEFPHVRKLMIRDASNLDWQKLWG